jgi:alpha-methylacyl-CoA racemase
VDVGGALQPGPSPKFSVTEAGAPRAPGKAGADTDSVLQSLGYAPADIARLREQGVVA